MFTGPDVHILLVHVVKLSLITEPYSSGYCLFVLQKHHGHHRSQLSWLYWPHEVLAAFEFGMEKGLHLELSCMLLCSQFEMLRKMFTGFLGSASLCVQQSECFLVF